MANTVITSTTNSIKVVFNDNSPNVGMDKGVWRKSVIVSMALRTDHIEVVSLLGARWTVVYAAGVAGAIVIDSVDAASPSSLSDLYDKLSALLA